MPLRGHQARRMKQQHYLPAADVLRVLCIGLIAWYHFWQLSWLNPGFSLGQVYIDLQQMIRNGYMLVDTLLLLSGFLLALPYARAAQENRPMPSAREFYKKRLARIVPSYAFAVLLVFFLWALPAGQYKTVGTALGDLFSHLSFTHNCFRSTYYFSALPGVLWTMAVEVQFYVLFPLLAKLYSKRPGLCCGGMIVIGQLFKAAVVLWGDLDFMANQLPLLLDVYGVGMLAAWFLAKLENIHFCKRRFFSFIAAFCLCCVFQILYLQIIQGPVKTMQMVWRLPMALFGGGFLLFGSLGAKSVGKLRGSKILRFLSGISYNFYIWHQFLARRLVDWNIPAHIAALPNQVYEQPWQSRYSLLVWLVAFAAAIGATYLIEKPSSRFLLRKSNPGKDG